MPYVSVGKENSGEIELYYEDHGKGRPVVLIHGWPLSGASWERQVPPLLAAGHRVITYDRRGFGHSSKPATGYDYNTLAQDLNALMTRLDLHDVTLVGFSMGGGEVARYLGMHTSGKQGSERVSQAVFISSVPPYLLKTGDNPEGVEKAIFDGIEQAIASDRLAFLSQFLGDFYNVDKLGGKQISPQVVQNSWNVAAVASPIGTLECVVAWLTDFRKDLQSINIPTLVIHGDADRILPISATGKRTHEMVKGSKMVTVQGGPHGCTWTHASQVNQALVDFVKQGKQAGQKVA
jgi:pimeloyl-ACP methyl ester carboxylesterase